MSYASGVGFATSRSPYEQNQIAMDQGAHSTTALSSPPQLSWPGKPSLPDYSAPVEGMPPPPPYQEPEQPYNQVALQQPQYSQAPSPAQPQAQTPPRVEWLPSQPQPQSQQLSLMAQRELQARMRVEKEETVKFLMNVLSGGKSKVAEIVERIPVTDPNKLANLREVLKLFEWDKQGERMLPFSWKKKYMKKLKHTIYRNDIVTDAIVTKDQRLSVRALIFYMVSEVDVDLIKRNQNMMESYSHAIEIFIFNISLAMRGFKKCDLEESTSERILRPLPPWQPGEYRDAYYFEKSVRDGFRLKLFPVLNEAYKPIFNAVRGKSD